MKLFILYYHLRHLLLLSLWVNISIAVVYAAAINDNMSIISSNTPPTSTSTTKDIYTHYTQPRTPRTPRTPVNSSNRSEDDDENDSSSFHFRRTTAVKSCAFGEEWLQSGDVIFGQQNHPNNEKYEFNVDLDLSSNGTVMAIGAYFDGDDGGEYSYAGRITRTRVYLRENDKWQQRGQEIDGFGGDFTGSAGSGRGVTVSLSGSGDIVAIGGWDGSRDGNTTFNSNYYGLARVYEFRLESQQWHQLGSDLKGDDDDNDNDDRDGSFAHSVSLSIDGLTMAVGSYSGGDISSQPGKAQIFHFNDGSWSQKGSDLMGIRSMSYFGVGVSIAGDASIVAIAAHSYIQAFVFSEEIQDWVQIGETLQRVGNDGLEASYLHRDKSSVSLSQDGWTLAASRFPRSNGVNSTSENEVRVLRLESRDDNNYVWVPIGETISTEATMVRLNGDGDIIGLGGFPNTDAKCVKVLQLKDDLSSWRQLGQTLCGANSNYALSRDGKSVASGADVSSGEDGDAGDTRIFNIACRAQIPTTAPPTNTNKDSLPDLDDDESTVGRILVILVVPFAIMILFVILSIKMGICQCNCKARPGWDPTFAV